MQGREVDEFDLLEEFFSAGTEKVIENIELLEAYYDCWCDVKKNGGIDEFFADHVSRDGHQAGEILADNGANYFADAISVWKDSRIYTQMLMLRSTHCLKLKALLQASK